MSASPTKMQANKQRADEMMALYEKGSTLNEVGIAYNLTRERVRQILSTLPEYRARENRVNKYHFVCICGNAFLSYHRDARYCSKKCFGISRRKYETAKDIRAIRKKRSQAQYQRNRMLIQKARELGL